MFLKEESWYNKQTNVFCLFTQNFNEEHKRQVVKDEGLGAVGQDLAASCFLLRKSKNPRILWVCVCFENVCEETFHT